MTEPLAHNSGPASLRQALAGDSVAAAHAAVNKIPLRVLFFEDQQDDVDLTLLVLRSSEFSVTADVATTPERFMEQIRATAYDVVLADYHMPRATGMDIFAEMKAAQITIPFILVTGSLGDERAIECLKEGVADYVLKDRLARLPVAIRKALNESRLNSIRAVAEDMLRRSEASYRSLIQSAPCGILRISSDGRLVEANPALAEMLGYATPAELLASSDAAGILLQPEMCALLSSEADLQVGVKQLEVEWRRKDGAPIAVRLSRRLADDEDGAPDCFELIAENSTERRRAEERNRQLNRLYSVLSQVWQAVAHTRRRDELLAQVCRIVVQEGLFRVAWVGLLDRSTGCVRPAAHSGLDPADVENLLIETKTPAALHHPVAQAILEQRRIVCVGIAEDPQLAQCTECALFRGCDSLAVFPILAWGRALGALAIYASRTTFFDDDNLALLDKLAGNLSFALESIEAEQMHRRAVDELDQFFKLSLDMLCIASLDGTILRLNPAWSKALGFAESEMLARSWFDFVHPMDADKAAAVLKALLAGQDVNALEMRFRSKTGGYRWLIGSATPVPERGLLFAAASDITDRKQLEEQLRSQNLQLAQQTERAEAANRLKSEFLANMSHELRSPLNGIIGFTELMYDGKLGAIPERPREYLNRIRNSALHLLELINGVLDLSKVEAGHMEFDLAPVAPAVIVQEVTGILAPLAVGKKIELSTEIGADLAQVVTDGQRLKQILHNYLSNALKFTGEGGRVAVRLRREHLRAFRIEVSDTGVGIPEHDLPRLFVAFSQLDATASKRYAGTGLGLALTKHIAEALGGRVGVHSVAGQGSTFFAVLPDVSLLDAGPTDQAVIQAVALNDGGSV